MSFLRLRTVFLARTWERLEVCASSKVSDSYVYKGHGYPPYAQIRFALWSTELATEFSQELLRQIEIVSVHNPALAVEVRVVTVVLSPLSAATIFPRFLDTVQVLRVPRKFPWNVDSTYWEGEADPIGTALAGHTFDSVRTLALQPEAFAIAMCCPNLECLTVHGRLRSVLPRLRELSTRASNLRVFRCLPLPPKSIPDLVKALPNLAEIPPIGTLGSTCTPDDLRPLASMKNLCKIELNVQHDSGEELSAHTMGLVMAAKEVLRGSSGASDRCVTLTFGAMFQWAGNFRRYPLD
ncbi:hypothetical protein B0H17DRAFT_1330174 [Mycena rosella]|uniref:Uncharacterized protein n=1 Tax=Mycena rosella TaxID=1033263 RepID=A0AAD7GLR5_MYCRO|nr:hypothetical protein B0H17DRAFT_1330174 [Mycena rosella]